ncbi:MAG: lipopolysaccharide heptosyltransferase family protein [Magnetospirillum sp.]|nr:MAG: lipopolysaccharide heptosyltransferase family protein [Magnetospirillum sp.]
MVPRGEAFLKLHRLTDPVFSLERRLSSRHGSPSGVLLLSAGGLGDTVLFSLVLPRFTELAAAGETVTVLLRSDGARMSFLFPPAIRVVTVDFARLRQAAYRRRIFAELYRSHYRLVVSTDFLRHPDLDEALAFACAAPETAAMAPRPWPKYDRRLTAHRHRWSRLFKSGGSRLDKVVRWARFADFLTGRKVPAPQVHLVPEQMPPPVPLERPTVVIQPFSAVKLKQSPPDLYRRIIGALPEGWLVRIAGHPSDLDKNPEYRPLLDLPGVSFEPAPFAALAGLLRSARLVISVDTACMHLAAALGVPTLCLASAAYVGEIVPYAAEVCPASVRFLWRPMDCAGCLGDCRLKPIDSMYPCVAALDGAEVIAAVRQMTELRS